MTNATKHDVKGFETIIGFDSAGSVVYSVTGTCGTLGTLRAHEEAKKACLDRYNVVSGACGDWYIVERDEMGRLI